MRRRRSLCERREQARYQALLWVGYCNQNDPVWVESQKVPICRADALGAYCNPYVNPPAGYLTSDSNLNIGRYIEMMITPTMAPTPIIISGSMIAVSEEIAVSTSSS
jgi:hypothetical protein